MNSSSRSLYDVWHRQHEVDRHVDTPWHRLLFQHLDATRDLADRHVLEIACGRGGLACHLGSLTQPPAHLLAADFSATAVAKGRAHAAGAASRVLRWSVSDLHAFGVRSAAFDTVISCESIEHLERPREACAEFARVLKPGGRLYLTTPNYLGPLGLYRGYARLRGRPYTEEGQPINRFMLLPRTCAWVHRAGLRIKTVDAVGHYLPWPGRPLRALPWLESWRSLRWFALHSLVVAEKP
jgi:SAM-dependent methyltransferase